MAAKKANVVRKQEFLAEYTITFPFIKKKDEYTAHCTICNANFSVAHSGVFDIKTHIKGGRHTQHAAGLKTQSTLTNFVAKDLSLITIKGECLMVSYLIEHDCALLASNHLSDLIKNIVQMFGLKQSFSCKRTKSTYITKTMAQDCKEQLVSCLKVKDFPYFSISTDGSNDQGFKKQLYPILCRYFNIDLKKVVTEVLSIPNMDMDSTGKNIFSLLNDSLKENKLDWGQCICFCRDNANVMLGAKAGVAAFVSQKQPNIFINGCTCHLAAIAAKAAAKMLPIHLEDVLLDIMYYMKGSSKRSRELRDIQESFALPPKMLLAYCATRWLSMGQCIPRLLELWPALEAFFSGHVKKGKKLKGGADKQPGEPVTKKVCIFFLPVILLFLITSLKKKVQTHELQSKTMLVLSSSK